MVDDDDLLDRRSGSRIKQNRFVAFVCLLDFLFPGGRTACYRRNYLLLMRSIAVSQERSRECLYLLYLRIFNLNSGNGEATILYFVSFLLPTGTYGLLMCLCVRVTLRSCEVERELAMIRAIL